MFSIWRKAAKAPAAEYRCYTIKAATGEWLVKHRGSGPLALGLDPAADGADRVLLCVGQAQRRFGYVFSPCLSRLAVEGHVPAGLVVPVRLIRSRPDEPVNLIQAFGGGRRLCRRQGGTLAFVPGSSGPDTDFLLVPVEAAALPAAARRLASEIGRHVRLPQSGAAILDAVRRGTMRSELAEPLLSSLSIDGLETFASALAASPADMRALQGAMRHDKWVNARLAALLRWRAKRPERGAAKIAVRLADIDDLAGAQQTTSHAPQLGLALNALIRARVQPRKMACVVASARNEGPYLLEWIAYHRSIGFEHIFLYTNENTDGSDSLLECLSRAGIITWLQNEIGEFGLPQFQAYAHALSVLPEILDYRWTLVADLDEYFGFDTTRFANVQDFLAWHELTRADAVAVPWLLHIAKPQDEWHEAPCIERFPMRDEGINPHVKSIFRTQLHWNSNCHHPSATLSLPTQFRLENGLPHMAEPPENLLAVSRRARASHAWIAHYIFKSAPEALMKAQRGKGDAIRAHRSVDLDRIFKTFAQLTEKTKLITDARTQACAAGLQAEMARLKAIPGVAAQDSAIKARFAAEMEKTCLQFLRRPARRNEPDSYGAFRNILMRQRKHHLLSGDPASIDAQYLETGLPVDPNARVPIPLSLNDPALLVQAQR